MRFYFLSFIFCCVLIYNHSCKKLSSYESADIRIYDESILSIIDLNSKIEVLVDSISLPEGPLWDEKSNSLLFTDIINNKVFKWNEIEGVSDYIYPSGNTGYAPNSGEALVGANALNFDSSGNLILCQMGDRRVSIIKNFSTTNPVFETLVDSYQGKRLNSPNDIIISEDGFYYFSDPAFGFLNLDTFQIVDSEHREINFHGIYKFNPKNKDLSLVTNEVSVPNGLALSLDQKYLYIKKMGVFDDNPKVLKLNLETKKISTLFDGRKISEEYGGDFDGIKVHSSGNIFFSGGGGILIVNPSGKLMARINFGNATNCAFDKDEKYLYVTGHLDNPKVYRMRLKRSINIGESIKIETH
ncbi:MAG: hypothetical protein CBD72_02765 [Flavobacteriaceae bacterium TMED212]|nr:MAG: hypothetical protein CBD72_02765 [Flavobacteriaceae bacterium TMED212]